jgi:hypothetical protein
VGSAARATFLLGLRALQAAADQPPVLAGDDTGNFLRRGATVASYNLLEAFVGDRLAELAMHINGGATHFTDLPDDLQERAIVQTLRVASARLYRDDRSLSELRSYSQEVGSSLASVGGGLGLLSYVWLWPGSNMSAEGLAEALRFLYVDNPWHNMRSLALRLSFPLPAASGIAVTLRDDLSALARERHRCAHNAAYSVTPLWLRALPTRLLLFAVAFDCLASVAAHELRLGSTRIPAVAARLTSGDITLRFVRSRRRDFAEYLEGRTRATSVDRDGDRLFSGASVRCGRREVLVRQDLGYGVVDWAVPTVD